jgi:hypothetical protein
MTAQRQWVNPNDWRRHPRTRRGPCPTCGGEGEHELIEALRARVAAQNASTDQGASRGQH